MYAWQYQQIISAVAREHGVKKKDSIFIEDNKLVLSTPFKTIRVDLSREESFSINDITEVEEKKIIIPRR